MRLARRAPRPTLLALLALAGCGGAQHPTAGPDPRDPRNLYPLAVGNVWSYDVDTGAGDPPTLGVTRVVRHDGTRFDVSNNGSDPLPYEIRAEGIYRPDLSRWLLRAPIEPAASWDSPLGRATVTSVTAAIDTPEGRFEGCVEVSEVGEQRRARTVYCPGIGPVLLELVQELAIPGQSITVVGRLRGHVFGGDDSAAE